MKTQIDLLIDFADMGLREGLSDKERIKLEASRRMMALAVLDLATTYNQLSRIQNGLRVFTPQDAVESDIGKVITALSQIPQP